MFGFVPAPCGCFSREDRSLYKAHFCGLCNVLRRRYGLWSRLLINRDATFLALLGSAISPNAIATAPATCCNPFGRKRDLVSDLPHLQYAAAVTVCGLKAKLDDDSVDESAPLRLAARGIRSALAGPVRAAKDILHATGFPVAEVESDLASQESCEHGSPSLQTAAAPTRRAYGAILAHLPVIASAAADQAGPLRTVGGNLGALIYAVDAWEDYAKDRKQGRFNPLPEDAAARRGVMQDFVQNCLAEMLDAFRGLRLFHLQELTGGIVYQNLPARAMGYLNGGESMDLQLKSDKEEKDDKRSRDRHCCEWCDCNPCECGDACEGCTKCHGCDHCGCDHCCCDGCDCSCH